MSLQDINLGVFLAGYIVNGRGDGAFTVKVGGVVGAGIHIDFADINVIQANEAALIPALHDQAVVLDRFIGILLSKSWIYIGVFLHDCNVIGKALVFTQQVLDDIVLFTGLDDPINGHILIQRIDHHLGITGNGVELG